MDFSNLINIRQTPGYATFMSFFKWQTISPKPGVNYFIRHIPHLGSIIKIEKINVRNIDLKVIEEIAYRENALFVKIEPFANVSEQVQLDKLFFTYGYVHDFWPLSSTSTFMLDLQKPLVTIIANFKSKFRYNLRLAENKHGLKVQTINGIDLVNNPTLLQAFTDIFNQRARQIKSETHSFEELRHTCKSHGDNLTMLYINHPEELGDEKSPRTMISTALFLFTPDICHYWHNGSTPEGRSLFAPTLIMAEGIRLAQEKGCKVFEFEGIYDERFKDQTRRWKGFTRFKEGFGPEKIVFVRPYIKYYSPVFKFFHFFKMI
jgi:lipid II:glycine glycyltransferase (peptidoglycan interpeptide bridge formation enzyme)